MALLSIEHGSDCLRREMFVSEQVLPPFSTFDIRIKRITRYDAQAYSLLKFAGDISIRLREC